MTFISHQNAYLPLVKVVRHSLKKLDVTHAPSPLFFPVESFLPFSIRMEKHSISSVFIILEYFNFMYT